MKEHEGVRSLGQEEQSTRSSREPTIWFTIVSCLIILPLFAIVVSLVVMIPIMIISDGGFGDGNTYGAADSLILLVYLLAMGGGAIVLNRPVNESSLQRIWVQRPRRGGISYLTACLGMFIASVLSMPLALIAQTIFGEYRMPAARLDDPVAAVAFVLATAVGAGVGEELVFRGFALKRLLQRMPARSALVLSTAMFCIIHIHPVHIIAVIPYGVWLGIVALRADSILPSIVAHAVLNFTLVSISTVLGPDEVIVSSIVIVGLAIIAVPYVLKEFRWNTSNQIDQPESISELETDYDHPNE